jgi:hypothetical protein
MPPTTNAATASVTRIGNQMSNIPDYLRIRLFNKRR